MSQSLKQLALDWFGKRQSYIESYAGIHSKPLKNKNITVNDTVQAVYAKLTSHQFCKQRPQDVAAFQLVIRHSVEQNEPIPCILGHGPLKNVNNCASPHADWSEFSAYTQLMKLAGAVKSIYEPGLSVMLYMDDARAAFANNVSWTRMDTYRDSVQELLAGTGLNQLIQNVVSLNHLYAERDHASFLTQAHDQVMQWQSNPANADALDSQILHAMRNLPYADTYSDDALREEAVAATYRYQLYYEAEKLCGIWDQPNQLYMRYSPHIGFYQIFTLRKGSVSQPWQGQGALMALDNGKLDPWIVTRSKTARYQCLEELAIESPVPGLQRLSLYSEEAVASSVQSGLLVLQS